MDMRGKYGERQELERARRTRAPLMLFAMAAPPPIRRAGCGALARDGHDGRIHIFFYLGRKPFLLTTNWHQRDRSFWQRQLGQYMASNSDRHLFFSAATGNFRKLNLDCKSVPAFGTRLELK